MDKGPANDETPPSSSKEGLKGAETEIKNEDMLASIADCKDNVPIKPGGRDVRLFNDHLFSELRSYAQVPNDFVNDGWNLASLVNGGGKGGTLMACVGDKYIVKELSRSDHETLLDVSQSYFAHVRSGETLLCPIYLHFQDVAAGRFFFAMRNSVGSGPFVGLYDIKGCADDKTIERDGQRILAVHKRIWNVSMWCCRKSWSEERHRYYEGKLAARCVDISLAEEQRAKVLKCIRQDTAWLVSHMLMDYSFLVAIKESTPQGILASGGSGPSTLGQRLILQDPAGGETRSLQVSIIDFLQRWTCTKSVAMCIKALETNKATVPPAMYADRFCEHFEKRIRSSNNSQGPLASLPTSKIGSVAPAAGDCDAEGKPEDRLHSRTMPESEASFCNSRPGGGEENQQESSVPTKSIDNSI
eukprot:TRINITY_DN45392_c0_g1_i1.p1 TRINITY_DN45392_c0_g1~~TRINITY_DN45392_c0_g1_i1.p1  ORF type:complete len:415 (-),score=73.01 TRINITY_DN45392_c0_g1_i1:410-1654(-)